MTGYEKVAIVLGMLFCLVFGSYWLGKDHGMAFVQAQWDENRKELLLANNELIKQHDIDKKRTINEYEERNVQVKNGYENLLKNKDAAIRSARAAADRNGGLRYEGTCATSSGVAANAETKGAQSSDGPVTGTIELPSRISDGLWAIINRAEAVTEQARACQNWIIKQGFEVEDSVDGEAESK